MKEVEIWKVARVGDEIECFFDHLKREPHAGIRRFKVVDITTRYGTGASPLIKALSIDGNKDWFERDHGYEQFSGHFITRILSSSKRKVPQPPKTNVHYIKDAKQRNKYIGITRTNRHNVHYGPLENLLFNALATMPSLTVPQHVSTHKARRLYVRTCPGLIKADAPWARENLERALAGETYQEFLETRAWLLVRKKPFVAWLKQNINRILYTVQELNEMEDRWQKEQEEDYYRDLEAEWDREHARNHPDADEPGDTPEFFEDMIHEQQAYESDREHMVDDDLVDPFNLAAQEAADEAEALRHDEHNYDAGEIDRSLLATFDQDDLDEAADYHNGHAALDEMERLRKMNEEAYPPNDPQPVNYGFEGVDVSSQPKTIGDLIVINHMNELLEKYADSSIAEEDIDFARNVLTKLRTTVLYEQDFERMAKLGAKIDEFDRIEAFVPGQPQED